MRWSFLLLILAAALLWGGGQGVYSYSKNPEPRIMTCAEYFEQRPDDVWIELSGCVMNLPEGMYSGPADHPSEIFVPIHPKDAPEGQKALIVLVSHEKKLLTLMAEMARLDRKGDEAEIEQWSVKNADLLFGECEIRGMVKFGLELDDDERSQIGALSSILLPEFVMLEQDAEPNLAFSLVMLSIGLLVLVGILVAFLRARSGPARQSGTY
ncbi:MAG: hypothetical protein JXR96_01670 [Deltaproteobacteria bacterium]|nr:hypothetical protein [Deltaproteobacteria bacterium]